jgi:hypothetical protein
MRRYSVIGFFLAVLVVGEITLYVLRRPRAAAEDPLPVASSMWESGTTTILVFDAPFEAAQSLRIEFHNPLGGAQVDVTGHNRYSYDDVTLLNRERVGTRVLDVHWPGRDLDRIRIEIHHHYRPAPVPSRWAWLAPAGDG